MLFWLRKIIKDLFAEKTRIVLTILAIAWGTFTIASMLAIGEGLRLTFGQAVSGLEKQVQIEGGKTSINYKGIPANRSIYLTYQDYLLIKKSVQNINQISPIYISKKSDIQYKNQKLYSRILGVDISLNQMEKKESNPPGRSLSPLDIKNRKSVVFLGSDIEKDLEIKENLIGKKIKINGKPFLVVGVAKQKPQLGGRRYSSAFDSWIPYTTYQALANPSSLDAIKFSYKNKDQLPQTEAEIRKIIAFRNNADSSDDSIVKFRDFSERQQTVTDFFLGMQFFLGIIGALTLLVAGVGIANVMYASVSRATHEIGIRMAIGARTHQILLHYVFEALLATMIGGIIGLGMTFFLVYGLNHIPYKMPEWLANIIGKPKAILSWNVLISVILVLGITGLFAGLFPALKASQVDPAEALRYE